MASMPARDGSWNSTEVSWNFTDENGSTTNGTTSICNPILMLFVCPPMLMAGFAFCGITDSSNVSMTMTECMGTYLRETPCFSCFCAQSGSCDVKLESKSNLVAHPRLLHGGCAQAGFGRESGEHRLGA